MAEDRSGVRLILRDPDFTLYQGDACDVLSDLADESIHCVVTSPPYWGLRDYGTGEWEGGDPECEHAGGVWRTMPTGTAKQASNAGSVGVRSGDCKCGARRVDRQLGLEATPDEYVANMVAVFSEVRRVLRRDGVCWIVLGDSYNAPPAGNTKPREEGGDGAGRFDYSPTTARVQHQEESRKRPRRNLSGLKPKDLVGIPWRVAFALQADGWYLRSDVIWSKSNPMPESVTDRPTKAHEYVFMLTRSARYWFDQEAVREEREPDSLRRSALYGANPSEAKWNPNRNDGGRGGSMGFNGNPAGRNVRSVWELATEPYAEAHFATYPQKLVERCLLAGCPEWVCGTCGKPRERIVKTARLWKGEVVTGAFQTDAGKSASAGPRPVVESETVGWSDCGHNNYRPGIVLDPFLGSGTTALVARRFGRRCVGVELNADYAAMAARRLQQLSLLADVPEPKARRG